MQDKKIWDIEINISHVFTDEARRKQLSISDIFADLSDFTMMKMFRETMHIIFNNIKL